MRRPSKKLFAPKPRLDAIALAIACRMVRSRLSSWAGVIAGRSPALNRLRPVFPTGAPSGAIVPSPVVEVQALTRACRHLGDSGALQTSIHRGSADSELTDATLRP